MKTVILGTAHRLREPGKQSPDGKFKECIYTREIVSEIEAKLAAYGIPTYVDMTDIDLPETLWSSSYTTERNRELTRRVDAVNAICDSVGKNNCIYISIHVDAAGSDGNWHNARGWSARVSPYASANSKLLAGYLFDAAKANGITTRQPLPNQKYWEQDLYVLNKTKCPAVLTENLFQDNIADVDFLLSDEGRHAIERLHIEGILKYIKSR